MINIFISNLIGIYSMILLTTHRTDMFFTSQNITIGIKLLTTYDALDSHRCSPGIKYVYIHMLMVRGTLKFEIFIKTVILPYPSSTLVNFSVMK